MPLGALRPRLSVVVPFYGVEAYIRDCLASIRDQSLRDIEVILVDDGSPDGSRVIAEEFCAEDPRFRLVTQENQGLGPARNTGTRAAEGEYLTFVDSDDLVSRHGFESMVDALDHTGSSLAGGNARRFNSSRVTRSWAHSVAFAKDRSATHVLEFGALVRDRMVWNKVYRRSFWDSFGYEFPAIRYEDYPVTLKAHIEAVTVDCLAQPVYYWRERESGDSITQQVFRYDNLRDRITSAGMVMSTVERLAPELRPRVAHALAESDLIAVYQAFAAVPDAEAGRLLDLGDELLDLLGAAALRSRHPYDTIQAHALRHRDLDLLRVLAERRAAGILGDRTRARTVPPLGRLVYEYPGRDRRWMPRTPYRVPRKAVTTRTTVTDVRWTDAERLRLRGTAEIRHVPTTEDSETRLTAVLGDERIDLPVRRFVSVDSHGDTAPVGFETEVSIEDLRRWAELGDAVDFEVSVRSGRRTRTGRLSGAQPGSPTWPQLHRLDGHTLAAPVPGPGGAYQIRWRREPVTVTAVEEGPAGIRLVLSAPGDLAELGPVVLSGGQGLQQIRRGCAWRLLPDGSLAGTIDFSFEELVAGSAHDEPVPLTRVRLVSMVLPPLPATAEEPTPQERWEAIFWGMPEKTVPVVRDDRVVRFTRTATGQLAVTETDVRATYADRVRVDDGVLVVEGPLAPDDPSGASLAWMHAPAGTDTFVDAGVGATVGGGRWSMAVPLDRLMRTPGHTAAAPLDEPPVWHLLVVGDGGAKAVLVDPFAVSQLPIRFEGALAGGSAFHGWVQGEPTLTQATGALRVTLRQGADPARQPVPERRTSCSSGRKG